MEKEVLINLIKQNLNQRQLALKLNCSQTNVRYWLKKYSLNILESEVKKCSKCSEDKSLSEFHNRRGKVGGSVYCKLCSNKESSERARLFKIKCVEYKGGRCEKCGYNKYIGALDFHHLDQTKKDFGIANSKFWSFNDVIKAELDKCILVCSNCHREIHGRLV